MVNDGKRWNNFGLQNGWCSDGSTSIWSERIREFKVRKCAAHHPDQSRRILKGNAHWLALKEAGTYWRGGGGKPAGVSPRGRGPKRRLHYVRPVT